MRGKIDGNAGSNEFQDWFEFLIENSLVGVCIIQKKRIKFANRFLLEILGYSLEELKEMNFWEIVAPKDRKRIKENKMKKEKGEKTPDRYQVKVLKKNGEIFNAELQDKRITYENLPAVMCAVIDVTKREKTMQRLSNLRELTSILAHDVRTPLHSISSAAGQLQLKKGEKLENHDVELLDLINKQTEKLFNILGDLLAYTKPENLSLNHLSINQLSQDTTESLGNEMKSKDR